jgi:hypothetical protein
MLNYSTTNNKIQINIHINHHYITNHLNNLNQIIKILINHHQYINQLILTYILLSPQKLYHRDQTNLPNNP